MADFVHVFRDQSLFNQKEIGMKEFALLFRQPSFDYKDAPEKMQDLRNKWQNWVNGIIAQDKLVSNGVRLNIDGQVLRAGGVVTDGPFVEIKEKLGSFIIVRAESLDDATTLAHGCPAIDEGGSVEIRAILTKYK